MIDKCDEPLDCNGCGLCAGGYLYDDPIDCMIEGEHLVDLDDDGTCLLCGSKESEVTVDSSLDTDYSHDFTGTIEGYKDHRKLICIRDQEDDVWDVNREAIKLP